VTCVSVCVVGGSGGSSKVKGSFLRMSSDGVSVKLTNPKETPGEGESEKVPPPVRKFIYDKVLNASVSAVLNSCASRVKAMKCEWDVQLDTTFVKIFEEDILVRMLNNVNMADWMCNCW
jgi:hypothetical protein